MVDWNADHISFVAVAYAIVALVLAICVAVTLRRASALRQTLADMKLSDVGHKDSL